MAMYLGSNKVEIGASSGGSSDFTTAMVTFVNSENAGAIYGAFIVEGRIDYRYDCFVMGDSAQLVIARGGAVIVDFDGSISSTAGAIEALGRGDYLITGDCTITIS